MDLKKFVIATMGVALSVSVANAQSESDHLSGVKVYTDGVINRTNLEVSKSSKDASAIGIRANGYRDYTKLDMFATDLTFYGYQNNVVFQLTKDFRVGLGCGIDKNYYVKLGGSTLVNGDLVMNGNFTINYSGGTNKYLLNYSDGDNIIFEARAYQERGNSLSNMIFKGYNLNFDASCSMSSDLDVKGKISCHKEIEVYQLTASNARVNELKAKDVNVELNNAADYVFEENYDLKSLKDVESYVKENKHLPGVPSAAEMAENGMSVSEMSNLLLEKVEELTLHMIQLQKENELLKAKVEALVK